MVNHIQLNRNVSRILQSLSMEDFERRTFNFKRHLERELKNRQK